MDQLDKKLYNDLNTQIEIPEKLDTIIKNGLNKKKSHYSFLKLIASVCIITFITSGVVLAGRIAGGKAVEKIWKEPQRVTMNDTENSDNESMTKENIMSEEEARKKGKEILEKFGYKNDKIKTIKLVNNSENYDLIWFIKTEQNISISFDAKGEELFSISDDDVLYKDIEKYRTTKKEAEKTAKELAKKYGYDTKQYSYTEVSSNLESESYSYIWNVTFYKEYDGIKNPYESIQVTFVPKINQIWGLSVVNKKFENNPVEITKEQAKEIALKEEQKISTKYEIKNIETELKIVSMNGAAYHRTNNYEQLQEQTSSEDYPYEQIAFYRTDSRIRKAWKVKIIYDVPDKIDEEYNTNDEDFSYFIDVTTGEVIGGSWN